MLLINISRNITRLRKSKDMSQKELADALFVSHQAVSKWENGKSVPSIEVLIMLTELFKVTIDLLLLNPDDRTDFKEILNTYDRKYCINSLIKGELDVSLHDVFYLLNSKEREKIIISIINDKYEVDAIEFWPLLNIKERLVYLRGLIRSKDYETIDSLKGMLRASEVAIIKNVKESLYEY